MNDHTRSAIEFAAALQQRLDDRREFLTNPCVYAGIVAATLHELAGELQALYEDHCNGSIKGDAYGVEEARLDSCAERAAEPLGCEVRLYFQTDPRGWPISVLFPGDVPEGESDDEHYTQGVTVPPYRVGILIEELAGEPSTG